MREGREAEAGEAREDKDDEEEEEEEEEEGPGVRREGPTTLRVEASEAARRVAGGYMTSQISVSGMEAQRLETGLAFWMM